MSNIAIKQPTKSILKHTYSEEHHQLKNRQNESLNNNVNNHIHNPSTWFTKFNSIPNRDDLALAFTNTTTTNAAKTTTQTHRLQSFLGSLRKVSPQQQQQQQQLIKERNNNNNNSSSIDEELMSKELAPRQLRRVRFPVKKNISTEYIFHKNDDTHIDKERLQRRRQEAEEEQESIHIQTAGQLLSLYESICRNKQEPTIDLLVTKLITQPNMTNLRKLDLTNQPLNRNNVSPLADLLCIDFGIRELVLNNCKLEDDAVKILMSSLLDNDPIEQLGLAENPKLTTNGFKYIAIYIKASKQLSKLDLSNNQLQKKSLQYILAAASVTKAMSPRLSHLVLNNCNLKGPQLEVLASSIRTSSIRKLSLRNNRITHHGALSIGVMLRDYDSLSGNKQQQGLNTLWLDHNEIGLGNGIQYLAQALRRNQNLYHLSMRDCKIDGKGCTLLGEALKYNQHLKKLDLGYNPQLCTEEGIAMLGQALRINKVLTELNFADTGLGTGATITLAECLSGNTSLEYLDLSNNASIGLAGCMAIAAAVQVNHVISHIDLGIPRENQDMVDVHNGIIAACTRNALKKKETEEQEQRPSLPPRSDSDSSHSKKSLNLTAHATARLSLAERLAAVTKNASNRRSLSRTSSENSLDKFTMTRPIGCDSTLKTAGKPSDNGSNASEDISRLIQEALDDLGHLECALNSEKQVHDDDLDTIANRCKMRHNMICLEIPSVTDAVQLGTTA
ncbi:hypothetical protein BDF20DRAFT_861298 [Mycotypha africana]|uniref:uncharacterized protein n=1 Tax=Mycotypha africana TaxID=64632 RepID=UPI0022FFECF2|nr:uncharacterized protein BDF20DRAFT_861298 [Mycotypha africana]KAI8984707.1 hypothetical protein BDF20DRAFT_861298 [Mycotypha africana]